MDYNKRFDQLESLLVDLARKVDQQGEAIERQGEAIGRQGEAIGRQGEAIGRQGEAIGRQGEAIGRQGEAIGRIEQRLDNIGEQIEGIIGIFKLSEARHTQAEQQIEALALEIKEQGRRTDEALQVQMQMLALMRATNAKADDLNQRLGVVEGQEPRIQRLEDQVFRAAS